MSLGRLDSDYFEGACLKNLLAAQVEDEGWFVAAPGYKPYQNYVWHRDNAECIMALDEFAATFGATGLFGATGKALARSFQYLKSKEKGVRKLTEMTNKLANPQFYNDAYHPHARLSKNGDELSDPWNNMQYDAVARTVIALAKHLSFTNNARLLERCKPGLKVAVDYLFKAIWDDTGPQRRLTVCANEWEEKDEPYLRGPLFSSVVGLLLAASRYYKSDLQQYIEPKDLDLKEYEKQTEAMFRGFFIRDGAINMIKRFAEPSIGTCSTSLWLLTTYDLIPPNGEVFNDTVDSIVGNQVLRVPLASNDSTGSVGLRRFELAARDDRNEGKGDGHIDSYWGGQAWLITTAQLATAYAMKGEVERANAILRACVSTRDADGRLPEQFPGTYYDKASYERWAGYSHAPAPPPWLPWSHAEVLRAYVAIYRAS